MVAAVAIGCGAFGTAETANDGADASAPGSDGAANTEAGAGADAAPRECKSLPNFYDDFERSNGTIRGEWKSMTTTHATLSIDNSMPIAGSGMLKVDVSTSDTVRNAYFAMDLPPTACTLKIGFLYREQSFTKQFTLLRVNFGGGSRLELHSLDDGTIELLETGAGSEAKVKPLFQVTTSVLLRFSLIIDLVARTTEYAILPPNPADAKSGTVGMVYGHADPQTLQLGAIDSPAGQPFAFFLDDFTLK